MPEGFQLSRAKGFRLPPGAVSVARPTLWGNPFPVGPAGLTAAEAVELFRLLVVGKVVLPDMHRHGDVGAWLARFSRRGWQSPATAALWDLRGRSLACWCPLGSPCHRDVWLEVANA